ncbi:hypothetical protein J560_4447, partial [Acinetobacter baumannii 855125]
IKYKFNSFHIFRSILAVELFGMNVATYAIITCLLAALFSGNCGLYRRKKLMD